MKVTDEDWALACLAIRGTIYDQLTSKQKNDILVATWEQQDGFGPGMPVSEWDWSGIRDSSQPAKQRIVDTVKALLKRWNVHINQDAVKAQAEESRKIREMLKNELPEVFGDEG